MTTYEDRVRSAEQLGERAQRFAREAEGRQPTGTFTMEAAQAVVIAIAGLTDAVLAVADRIDALVGVAEERG